MRPSKSRLRDIDHSLQSSEGSVLPASKAAAATSDHPCVGGSGCARSARSRFSIHKSSEAYAHLLRFSPTLHHDGWTGLNLHYLPPRLRVQLLDALYEIYNNKHLDEKRRLNITYTTLQSVMRIRYYQPTVKRYLTNHLRSKIYVVDPHEWDLTLMLPTERFVGKSKQGVWNDSRQKLGLRNY